MLSLGIGSQITVTAYNLSASPILEIGDWLSWPVHGRLVAFITSLNEKFRWITSRLSAEVGRTRRLCQDLQASPGVEPRAFNDVSQPPNFLTNTLILGDEKRQYLLLATYSTMKSSQKKPIISLGCRYYTIRSKHMSYLPLVIGPPAGASVG